MNNKYTFYFQENNTLFNGPVLSVCYKADENEISHFGLTGENVLIILKSSKLSANPPHQAVDFLNFLKHLYEPHRKIFLRIQSECLLGIYGDSHCDCETQRREAMQTIAQHGDGIFIHLPQEGQGRGLHYKLAELELQVSGRDQEGKYVGEKNRDEAQKILTGNKSFSDMRKYELIKTILADLQLDSHSFVLLSENHQKIDSLRKVGLKIEKMSEYQQTDINENNLSEFLIKILNGTHSFDEKTIEKVIKLIENRQYNGRALSTIVGIVDKIENDKTYRLPVKMKKRFLEVFENIICGEKKRYIVDGALVKIQNNFSCKVNSSIFQALRKIYGFNVFDRISLENLYYFEGKTDGHSVRIRTSKVLETKTEDGIFIKGQVHVEQKTFSDDNRQIMQCEISLSKLRSFFENNTYDYVKHVEMITMVSEKQIPGVNLYVKKIPNIENRIMDIYGEKENIQNFVRQLSTAIKRNPLNEVISNSDYEDENFTNYNLRFADANIAIEEELEIYQLLNGVK